MNETFPATNSAVLPMMEMQNATAAGMYDPTFIVLKNVDWVVMPGDFWVVGGQQHSGKTDLVLLAAGVLPPAEGNCKLFGIETRSFGEAELAKRLRVGFVFQGGQLFSRLTVVENIALPLSYHKNLDLAEAAREAKTLLDLMELTPLADMLPANIPANWRHRAVLARALMMKPELLLLDNPLGGLASRHLFWWRRFLDQLWRGHEFFGGGRITIAATTDDFRPWRNAPYRFAFLHDQRFVPLGGWQAVEASEEPTVKELLAVEPEPMNKNYGTA